MLSNVGLARRFWAEVVNTACYLINRGPHTGIHLKTPCEMWSGNPADYSNLKFFGCPVYYHINEGKLEPRARKGVFLGYGDGVKGYRIWSPSENRVIISRNVVFDENSMFNPIVKSVIVSKTGSVEKQVEHQVTHDESEPQQEEAQHSCAETAPTLLSNQHSLALGCSRRANFRKPPTKYGFEDMVAYALQVAKKVDPHESSTYKEAVICSKSTQWIAAM